MQIIKQNEFLLLTDLWRIWEALKVWFLWVFLIDSPSLSLVFIISSYYLSIFSLFCCALSCVGSGFTFMLAPVLVLPCIPLFWVPITLPPLSSPQQVQYPPPPTHQYRQPWGFQEYRVQNSSTPSILKGFLWLNRFQALKRLMSWEGKWTNCLTALIAPLLPPYFLPKASKNWPMIISMRVPRRFPFLWGESILVCCWKIWKVQMLFLMWLGKSFHVYKLVLAARSPVFQNEFFLLDLSGGKWLQLEGVMGSITSGRPNVVKRHKKMNSWFFKGPASWQKRKKISTNNEVILYMVW